MIVHIPLEHITANPWQPRQHEDLEKIAVLRDSILANHDLLPKANRGLYHIPMARVIDAEGDVYRELPHRLAEIVGEGEGIVQLAFGHRRFAAFQLLASGEPERAPDDRFREFPLELLALNDRQMAELAARENVERVDLTWIERAKSMNRFILDFGATQTEVAALFGLSSQSAVAHYLRAMEALEEFNSQDLLHAAETGDLPLKHALHLAPLLREKPVEARQWLARNPLIGEDGDIRPATWIKAEIDQLLEKSKPAPPPETLPWFENYERLVKEHDPKPVFMRVGKSGTIYVALGATAAKVASAISARVGEVRYNGRFMPGLKLWISDSHREAKLLAALGDYEHYLEPDPELKQLADSQLAPADFEQERQEDSTPALGGQGVAWSPSTSNRGAGLPPSLQPKPRPATPITEGEGRAVRFESPVEEPVMSEEERQAYIAERMAKVFPGAAPVTIPDSDATGDALLDTLADAADYLREALNLLAGLPEQVEGTDLLIANHLQGAAHQAMGVFVQMIGDASDPGTLAGLRERIDAAERPESEVRQAFMDLIRTRPRTSQVSPQEVLHG